MITPNQRYQRVHKFKYLERVLKGGGKRVSEIRMNIGIIKDAFQKLCKVF